MSESHKSSVTQDVRQLMRGTDYRLLITGCMLIIGDPALSGHQNKSIQSNNLISYTFLYAPPNEQMLE